MENLTKKRFVPHSNIPYGEEGTGFYSANSSCCFDVVQEARPLVLKALDLVPPQEGTPFVISDYGTADGGSSMSLLEDCVKKHGRDKEIMVYYEDQPINDFKRVHGLLPGPPSYAMEIPGVYTACVGTNFYDRCFPANTVNLALSFTAIHWLSERPSIISDSLDPIVSCNETEKNLFKLQASHDWETFLLARAYELVTGGQMVIACLAVDENGQYIWNTKRVRNNLRKEVTRHWDAMVADGKITREEFVNTNFNNYFRTMEDFKAPFNDANSNVSQAGLHLVSIEMRLLLCPYHTAWVTEHNQDDKAAREAYAKQFALAIRTWSNSSFRSGLDSSRSEEEKDQIVDALFGLIEAEVAASPQDNAMDLVHAYMHIEKM